MIKKSVILIIMVLSTTLLSGETDIFGYFENRFFLINAFEEDPNEDGNNIYLGDYNRIRLKLKSEPAKNVTVNLALDLFTFHGFVSSPFGVNENNGKTQVDTKENFKIDLDRAFVDIHFKKFDVTIGKQRVAMGVSYIWAPLDVFNRINIFEPKEEKPGVNAFKVYVPLGKRSSFMGVFSPEKNFSSSKSGIRFQTLLGGIDIGLTLINRGMDKELIYGIDLRGENFIGWWLECGFFDSDSENNLKVVFGFDYTFPVGSGIYWMNEYFYDQSGEKNISIYNYDLLNEGGRFTLGKEYFISMLRYGLSDFLSASVSYIGNWDDGSYIINPSISYEVFQNVSLTTGAYFPFGQKGGEFNRGNMNAYFVWLKINF